MSLQPKTRTRKAQCVVCASEFVSVPTRFGWTKYCSRQCAGAVRRRPVERECPVCGDQFVTTPTGAKACSPRCANEMKARSKRGAANPMARTATRAKVQATRRARRDALDADLPPQPMKCRRPGCQNPLVGQASFYCSPRCHYADRARAGGSSRREQPYHRCRGCGGVFAWNGQDRGVFCSRECVHSSRERLTPDVVEVVVLRGYRRRDWNAPPLGSCMAPGCERNAIHRHHVVYEQHVIRYGGDRWDPANQMRLCRRHHLAAHAGEIAVTSLPTSAIEFAVALIGPAARDYLRRRYAAELGPEWVARLEHAYPEARP